MSDKDAMPSLDPREILSHLNEMGIRNVSAEMLKEFISDLKKLIKYDMKNKLVDLENQENEFHSQESLRGPERLFSCSTFSSRSKSVNKTSFRTPLSNVAQSSSQSLKSSKIMGKINSPSKLHAQEHRRVKSASSASCKSVKTFNSNAPSKGSLRNSNLIKVPIVEKPKKSDPVSLYHYYNTLWEKYKSNRPGENSWADLRWSVREKLLGVTQHKQPTRVAMVTPQVLAKRREGWVEK